MAGHAQLKFVMTECSKTQIHLTGLISFVSIQNEGQLPQHSFILNESSISEVSVIITLSEM